MINREEFGEKTCGLFCTANEARKCTESFARFFAQTSARVIKICRRNFALGKLRRKEGGFYKMHASLGCGALSAKSTAGANFLRYFLFPWP